MGKKKDSVGLPGEDARKRSVRLANRRVSNVLRYVELVGNLGSANYDLTEAEKETIIGEIDKAIVNMKLGLEGKSVRQDRFKLANG